MRHQWLGSTWLRISLVAAVFVVAINGAPLKVHAMSQGGIIALTNNERANNGLGPLAANGQLNASAQAKAQDMVLKGYFGHTGPDGLTPWSFVSSVGYPFVAVAENLAQGYGSDGAVVAGWMGSPGHRTNLLNGAFRDVGIGIASGIINGASTTVIVAHYGATTSAPAPAPTPAPTPRPTPAPAPKNETPAAQETTVNSPENQTIPASEAEPTESPAAEALTVHDESNPVNQRRVLIEDLLKLIEYGPPNLIFND